MNLRQLEALHKVLVTGTVSEAAKELYRTQSAVTALIKGLEESVGLPLFERRGRRLVPLPEAHYLHEEAKEILQRLERTKETMDSFRSYKSGRLRVASTLAPSLSLVPGLLSEVLADNSEIHASLVTGTSLEVHHLVASQQVDVGIGDLGYADMLHDTTMLSHQSFSMDALVAVASDDPLASAKALAPGDLSGRSLALLSDEHNVHTAVAAAFDEAEAAFTPRLLTQSTFPKFIPIRNGVLTGIVDPMTANAYRELTGGADVAFLPFRPRVTYEFAVMKPAFRPLSHLAKAFFSKLVERIPSCIET